MAYTTIDKPDDYFNTVLYTGTGATNAITGVGFQPDFLWIKDRTVARVHYLADRVRGDTKYLQSQATTAEITAVTAVQSIDSDGFTTGTSTTVNNTGENYVAWNWKAGGTAVSNTAGSITSSVSANTTAGFSIVSYTGNGSAGATIGHGLGVKPAMMIIKNRISGVESWQVYHQAYGTGTQYFLLNDTGSVYTYTTVFNDTAPDADKFTVGTAGGTNGSSQGMIAYCFAEVKGYSKFGSYTGNGSADGTFVYTGFKPAFVIQKNASASATPWFLFDNKRNPFNKTDLKINPNSTDVESAANEIDMLSNGFKVRTSGSYTNGSGNSIIYMAFAENPFVTSTGIPTPAR